MPCCPTATVVRPRHSRGLAREGGGSDRQRIGARRPFARQADTTSKASGGIRTRNFRFTKAATDNRKPVLQNDLQQEQARRAAPGAARNAENGLSTDANTPPELAQVIAAWPSLPEPVKAGIVAMVNAATGGKGRQA